MKLNWNFLGGMGGGGCKTKNLPWGEYGYFLELHITKEEGGTSRLTLILCPFLQIIFIMVNEKNS